MKYHGSYTIEIIGRVLEVKAIGEWNEETAEDYIAHFLEAAATFSGEEWGVLVDGLDWGLGTPGTVKIIQDTQEWCIRHNQRYEASVFGTVNLKKLQMEDYMATLDRNIVDQRYFNTIEEAKNWFSEIGLYSI